MTIVLCLSCSFLSLLFFELVVTRTTTAYCELLHFIPRCLVISIWSTFESNILHLALDVICQFCRGVII